VQVVPKLLVGLSVLGTAAMLWVGGGIILHGLEELHILEIVPHTIHEWSVAAGHAFGGAGPAVEWLVFALGGAVAGLIVGGIIVAIVRQFTSHPEDLVVDL
jgi:predicted DNA repair protein MutK